MDRRTFVVVAPLLLSACAAPLGYAPAPGGADRLATALEEYMGTDRKQTVASAAGLFALAQNSLPRTEFIKLMLTLPGVEEFIDRGAAVGEFDPARITDWRSLTATVARWNVNPAQLSAMADYVVRYVSSGRANVAADRLREAWS